MSDAELGTGFRFGKIMAWAPAIVLILAVMLIATGETMVGLLVAVFALLVWLLVSRRKKRDGGSDEV